MKASDLPTVPVVDIISLLPRNRVLRSRYSRRDVTLQKFHEIPRQFQDNPFLIHGYMYNLSACECMSYAVSPHNQTFNVWTSVAGLLLFTVVIFQTYSYYTLSTYDTWLIGVWFLCNIIVNLVSSVAHLFGGMNLTLHAILFQLDGFAIGFLFLSRIGVNTEYGFPLDIGWQQPLRILVILCTCLSFLGFCVLKVFAPWAHRGWVIVMMTPTMILMNIPFVYKLMHWSEFEPWLQIYAGIALITGAVCYGLYIPERFCPGLFDHALYSHPIWHVGYVGACFYDTVYMLFNMCHTRNLQPCLEFNPIMVRSPLVILFLLLAYSFTRMFVHHATNTENPHWSYLRHFKHHSAETNGKQ